MTIKDLIKDAISKAFTTIKSNLVQNTSVSTSTAIPSAAVTNNLQTQINTLNSNATNRAFKSGTYKNTTSGWEYSGIYYDFPAGNYVVWIGIGYSSQRPDGVALHTESTGSGYFQAQYVDTTNGIGRKSPLFFIIGGFRYYLMVKRANAASAANDYSINGFKLS